VLELADLGIVEHERDRIGVPAHEWTLAGLNGRDIYSESRGNFAGYRWHQYVVHRGGSSGCSISMCWRASVPMTSGSVGR
jgi:hypothetical protein